MNRLSFDIYQYLSPLILGPLSFWLWWQTYQHDIWLTLLAWLIPIMYAYIVPGIGTNILKVWEFNTRFRLGRFRPHHGFVFGSATATIVWFCHWGQATSYLDPLKLGVISACVLGFINLLYDIKAIESGVLLVYNQPWADGKGATEIAMDYSPWFFAGFGLVYGFGIGIAELMARHQLHTETFFMWYFPVMLIVAIILPVWGYRRHSLRIHGHTGCRPISRIE